MEMKLNDFNRRGAICAFNKRPQQEMMAALSNDDQVVCRAIADLQAKYFVVMKRISEDHMLVAPVFEVQKRKDCKGIRINNKRLWVNFMTFYVVPVQIMEAVPGKYLDYPYRTICAIYDSHNHVLKEKWRRENEQRIMDQELRRQARERKRNEPRYNMDYLYPIPEYMQQGARHPIYAGSMAGK